VRAGDTVARLGGDEFVLLLGDLADVEECEQTLDRVVDALHAHSF
jgi:GGDEF domain-containing protein